MTPERSSSAARTPRSAGLFPPLSEAEWRWVAVATLVIWLLSQIPPTAARWLGPQDRVHVGTYWFSMDFPVYLSVMNEGGRGESWLAHNHTSAEPHSPALIFPLYVLLGKVAQASGLPNMAVYGAVETLGRLMLPTMLYLFAASCLSNLRSRRLAFLLMFGSGLGVWALGLDLLFDAGWAGQAALNTFVELFTPNIFFAATHITFGMIATLASILLFDAACQRKMAGKRYLAGAILSLALIHPFNLPVLLATFITYAIGRSLAERRLHAPSVAAAATAALAGVPLLAYNFSTFTFDPFWSRAYGAQNIMLSPRPWELLIDLGAVLILGAIGATVMLRSGPTTTQAFFLTWTLVILVFMYLPVPYQRRFAFGLQPSLAILAVLGLPALQSWAAQRVTALGSAEIKVLRWVRRLTQWGLAFAVIPGTLFVMAATVRHAIVDSPLPLYTTDRDTYSLGERLAVVLSANDVVLASLNSSNALVGLLPGRVVVGAPKISPDAEARLQVIKAIYSGELSESEVRVFLRSNHVTHIVVGSEERRLGPDDPGDRLGFPVLDRVGSATAYVVRW